MSSTWPASILTPGLSSSHLTINQASSVYKLAAECQALGIKLAKKFQVLSGLEAIHCNSIQGTAHEMLMLRHSAWKAAYFAMIRDRVPDDECKATTCHLCSEADVAWKEMHEVMYNYQLHYDGQLAMFLADAETALSTMRDQVWEAIHALAESGYHARCLPGSRTTSAQPAPADTHQHVIPQANTPHHRLLPGIFHL